MTTNTTTEQVDEQGSDRTAECDVCGEPVDLDKDFYEYRKRTGGRLYRHEECHQEVRN